MDIVISHICALQLIRCGYWPAAGQHCPCDLPTSMPTVDDVDRLKQLFPCLAALDRPIDVLVGNYAAGHATKRAVAHVRSAALPAGALFQLAPGVRCASPLFVPTLLTTGPTHLELALLLAELMGLYAIDETSEFGMVQRARPLFTKAQAQEFLDRLGSARGAKRVRRALEIAPEMAASPQEAKLYLRATLPLHQGGYNMGDVVLNDPVELRRISASIKTLRTRKPDLLFVAGEKGACLDYMGAWHARGMQPAFDAQRRNELLAAGFKPYEIFKANYDDLDYMDGLMRSIQKQLGLARVYLSKERQVEYRRARENLWRSLERADTSIQKWGRYRR